MIMVQAIRHLARSYRLSVIKVLVATATLGATGCDVPTLDRTIFLNASVDHPGDLGYVRKRTVQPAKAKCAPLNATRLSQVQKDQLFQQFDGWQQDRQNDPVVKTRGIEGASGQPSGTRTADPAPGCLNAR